MAHGQLRTIVVLLTILSMSATPFITQSSEENISPYLLEGGEEVQLSSPKSNHPVDLSPWRISDKWTHETVFDVAGLIAAANISGTSVNSLTGDTVIEIIDIIFLNINGTQTLTYEVKIEGDFTSGNNGATFPYNDGTVSGKVNVDYIGTDYIRVSDLATIRSQFAVDVEFLPFNIGLFSQDLGSIQVNNTYWPPKEDYDFPLSVGDTWNSTYYSKTEVTGQSDYFDLDGLDSNGTNTTYYQVTSQGAPTEDGSGITYSGCSDALKISSWNSTNDPSGFKWYCPNARYYGWNSFQDSSLGLQIDWKLKSYSPTNSQGVSASSSPGIRRTVVDATPQFDRVRPDTILATWGNYSSNLGQNPKDNTNLQLRWEHDGIIQSLTTAANGSAWTTFDVGHTDDNTSVNDDEGSHGVIIWDPVEKIVGVKTIVLDPLVTAIDLVAKQNSVIVQRNRSGIISNLNPNDINVLPGDSLQFWLITQNRGTQLSPATELEVSTPDGSTNRTIVPALPPLGQVTVTTNWTVPIGQAIGNLSLTFEVDPDELITEDGNKTNNFATVSIFVGRSPIANVIVNDGVYTHENATINASTSYDPDGGEVECDFAIDEDKDGVADQITFVENCTLEWAWVDDGDHMVWISVYDDEGDVEILQINISVLNQAPWIILSGPESAPADSEITITASEYGDADSHDQPVSISWPNSMCQEGLTQPTCTFSVFEETAITVIAIATDEDGAETQALFQLNITNMPPILQTVELWIDGEKSDNWTVNEDQIVELRASGYDTSLDLPLLVYDWRTDADLYPEMRTTTSGENSAIETSWNTSGEHRIQVELFDDDGISGGLFNRTINVTNVAPTIPPISEPLPLFEDQEVSMLGGAIDSPSDTNALILCWDIDSQTNSDGNGTAWDDCDIPGSVFAYSFSTRGIHIVSFHATDDDGASAWQNISVTIINKAPEAMITSSYQGNSISVEEGGSITFYGNESVDTPTDGSNLWMWWDSTCHDGDNDGILVDDIDAEDSFATFSFSKPGTCTITLHVEDDNGEADATSVNVDVLEKPLSSALVGNLASTGGIATGLVLLLLLLVSALIISRRKSSPNEDLSASQGKAWDLNSPSRGILSMSGGSMTNDSFDASLDAITNPPFAINTQTAPLPSDFVGQVGQQASYHQPTSSALANINPASNTAVPAQPTQLYSQTEFANLADEFYQTPTVPTPVASAPTFSPPTSAPPVPANGLPLGWSQQQWEIYGAKWLEEQEKITPTLPRTNKDLSELLDDLDF